MDAVRFGRVLGVGARQAAKTVVSAVDAATSESPSPKKREPQRTVTPSAPQAGDSSPAGGRPLSAAGRIAKPAARVVVRGKEAKQGLRRGGSRFREAAWNPVVRLSGVLWLEVMGVFFGIFALFATATVWRLRASWHTPGPDHRQWLGAVAMLVVFGYFCVSSFIRAKRRERGR